VIADHNIYKPLDFRGDFRGVLLLQGYGKSRMNRKFDEKKSPIGICMEYRFWRSIFPDFMLKMPMLD